MTTGGVSATQRALIAIRELRAQLAAVENARSEPIAIVGMGCRFPPNVDNGDAFWRLLDCSEDAVHPPPASRPELTWGAPPDPECPSRPFERPGAYLQSVDGFDPGFFSIAPRELAAVDPQQRLLLETAYEAIEDAGIPLRELTGSPTAVYIGAGVEDYAQLSLRSADQLANDAYAFTGSDLSFAAGRIAYCFGLQGPAMVIDTTCSSSLVALHLAVRSLRQGESSLALVGGVNLLFNAQIGVSLCKAGALAPDGRCKTFDAGANGYGRGEGCCVLVLKRYSEALAAGDRVLSLVLGTAVNQDGASSGLTVPNGLAQQALLRQALQDARVVPGDVDYVEAHGTGTPLGDPIEVGALSAVFSEGRSSQRPLALGSVKTQIGHLEAASGIAGVVKVALALKHERLPANLHFNSLNPLIDLDAVPARVVNEPLAWPRGDRRRVAGVSAFGMSGTNAHVVIGEPPLPPAISAQPGRLCAADGGTLFTLSARSQSALDALTGDYVRWLSSHAAVGVELDALCREAAVRRSHHPFRRAIVVRDLAQLRERCAALVSERPAVVAAQSSSEKPVFIFDGQGGQWLGMVAAVAEASRDARVALEAFDAELRSLADWSLLEVLNDASSDWLRSPAHMMPALCAVQIALAAHWSGLGITPSAVVGHSVGEVAAAHVAGILSLSDAVAVVHHRARLMARTADTGSMLSLPLSSDAVRRLLSEYGCDVSVATLNAPELTAVSGSVEELARFQARLQEKGIRVRPLAVNQPTHSKHMDPILSELRASLGHVRPRCGDVPFWSTVTGEQMDGRAADCDYWVRNVREPVRFAPTIRKVIGRGVDTFVEIGPHPVLTLPISMCAEAETRDVTVVSSMRRDHDASATVLEGLGTLYTRGHQLDWPLLWGKAPRAAFDLPRYPWQRQSYLRRPSHPAPAAASAVATKSREAVPDGDLGSLHDISWMRASEAVIEARRGAERVVVLADQAGLGVELAERFARSGVDVAVVLDVERSGVDAPCSLTSGAISRWYCSFDDAEALTSVLARLLPEAMSDQSVRLVHLGNLDLVAYEARRGPADEDTWRLLWNRTSATVRALTTLNERKSPSLTVVMRGAHDVGGRGGTTVLQSMAWSLWGSVGYELGDVSVSRIDLDPMISRDRDLAALARELDGEFEATDAVAYRQAERWVPRLVPAKQAEASVPLRGDANYVITGGLGALGLAVAGSFVSAGARHLTLVSRRAPGTAQQLRIAELERAGATVHCIAADVADAEQASRLIGALTEMPRRVRGFVHAAGVLEDGLVVNQGVEQFVRVVAPKVAGAWHIGTLTADWSLDFFCCFSSVASVLCPPGQGNYAAANAGLDAIARQRRRSGLAAVSVAWGPWQGGGMATALDEASRERLAARGLGALDVEVGLRFLHDLLGSRRDVVVMPIDNPKKLAQGFSYRAEQPCALLSDYLPKSERARLVDRLRAVPQSRRLDDLRSEVERLIRAVLANPEPLRCDVPFAQLGMDSLMTVMARNSLASAFELKLPTSLLFDCPTVNDVATELYRRVSWGDVASEADSDQDAQFDAESDLALLGELTETGFAEEVLASLDQNQEVQP